MMAAMDRSNLRSRGAEIALLTERLARTLATAGSEEPSFELGLPKPLGGEEPDSAASAAKQELLLQVDELRALLTDPALLLTHELRNPLLSTHAAVSLGIAESFPPSGTTVQELATKLNLRESLVRRLLAHCATHHVYFEERPDFFVHTAASRLMADSDGMRKWILLGSKEMLPATLKVHSFTMLSIETWLIERPKIADALVDHADSEEPEHCGWSMQNNTDLPVFKALATMPQRAMIFADAMKWQAMLPGASSHFLVEAFPFVKDGKTTVVDVGGGLGHVSQALVNGHFNAYCIVEDWPDVVAQGQQNLPAELENRISFQAHDFFQNQPVAGADVYLLRMVLHDWSDKYAKKIIKALVPALKPGAKVVVNDRVVPEFRQASYLTEREARDYDMYMLAFQNAKERTASEWEALFAEVDPRFRLERIHQPPRSTLAIVEMVWAD